MQNSDFGWCFAIRLVAVDPYCTFPQSQLDVACLSLKSSVSTMTDLLTALSVAAAAAQLAGQAYDLVKFFSDLYGKLKEAPELTKARVLQLEHLQNVSNLIKKTKILQTNEVQAVLVACLQTTMDLREILVQFSPKRGPY